MIPRRPVILFRSEFMFKHSNIGFFQSDILISIYSLLLLFKVTSFMVSFTAIIFQFLGGINQIVLLTIYFIVCQFSKYFVL